MSRLTTMSPDAIKAVFSPNSDSDMIVLLTIYDPIVPSTVSVRLSDGYTQRISENSEDVLYGVKSRGNDFIFIPMEVSLPTEEEAQAPRCSISVKDVSRYLIPTLRQLQGPPKVLLEIVLSKTPSIVEASFSGFYITNVGYTADTVSIDLSMIDYDKEPFPAYSFTPYYFPGLF